MIVFTKGALALLAGLVVTVLLLPLGANAPPTCHSLLGFVVPCGAWLAWGAGLVAAVLIRAAWWWLDRLRERREPTTG